MAPRPGDTTVSGWEAVYNPASRDSPTVSICLRTGSVRHQRHLRLHHFITLLTLLTTVSLAGLSGWRERLAHHEEMDATLTGEAEARLRQLTRTFGWADQAADAGAPPQRDLPRGMHALRLMHRVGGRWQLRWEIGEPASGPAPAVGALGLRALRTKRVQSTVNREDQVARVESAWPLYDRRGRQRGLLIASQGWAQPPLPRAFAPSLLWALGGAGLLSLLLWGYLLRPLRRLQDELRSRELLDAADLAHPVDLLREVTRVLDKADSDRDWFENRIRQQESQHSDELQGKEDMLANVVHELRTPLSSSIASVELLLTHRDRMSETEQHEFLEQVRSASQHLMFLVNDLLDTAAVRAGRIRMDIAICPVQAMLADAQRAMESLASSRGMVIEHLSAAQGEILARGDQGRTMQVIFNLLSNAVKYSPADSRITISATQSHERVLIEIEDEGEIIPPHMQARLFNRFAQLPRPDGSSDQGRSSGANSSGIGLYLSKKLIELMDGQIGYRAGQRGSCFWFTLPVAYAGVVETCTELDAHRS